MSTAHEIRDQVAKTYSERVAGGGGCCGGGTLVEIAGYRAEELAELPREAAGNAFGCGNPVAFTEMREGETVLDLGCGAGIDLLLAARKVGPNGRVIGVDMTDAMIERARQAAAEAGLPRIEVRKGIVEDLPVESASVDWVISNCVLNLSPEKPKAFAEIARVLKPGGRMLVSDIVADGIPEALRESRIWYDSCVGGAIPEEEYLAGLRAAGLEEVRVVDRLVYDAEQLVALAPTAAATLAGSAPEGHAAPLAFARTLAGRIASVQVAARRSLSPPAA